MTNIVSSAVTCNYKDSYKVLLSQNTVNNTSGWPSMPEMLKGMEGTMGPMMPSVNVSTFVPLYPKGIGTRKLSTKYGRVVRSTIRTDDLDISYPSCVI